MIVAIAVKLMTWAISLGLSKMVKTLDDLWDILEPLNAPPAVKHARSRMRDLMRRHEARRIIKALRS